MTDPNPITSPNMDHPLLQHGYFTRVGGVSGGIYRGLNIGIGSHDDPDAITENRKRVCEHFALGPNSIGTPYQIHSPDVFVADDGWTPDKRPQADAVVTKRNDLVIGVVTADCGPVLFADAENGVVAAAHAGWKGATGGVLENTIDTMISTGADRSNIVAVLGPTISRENYEVGPEFVERLTALDSHNSDYLGASVNTGHAMFDLPSYIVDRLKGAGISASWTGQCTYADEELFFSYRRTTHRKEVDYGRQISAIRINQA